MERNVEKFLCACLHVCVCAKYSMYVCLHMLLKKFDFIALIVSSLLFGARIRRLQSHLLSFDAKKVQICSIDALDYIHIHKYVGMQYSQGILKPLQTDKTVPVIASVAVVVFVVVVVVIAITQMCCMYCDLW